jgi:hypothetical protein
MKVRSNHQQRLWQNVARDILHESDLGCVHRLLFELLEAIEDQLVRKPLETQPPAETPIQWIQ